MTTQFDPITLEVLRNAMEATAQEMGVVLKHTAFSPNIKERMDASCSIFDAQARLVAQAEHVPVMPSAPPPSAPAIPRPRTGWPTRCCARSPRSRRIASRLPARAP